MSEHNDCIKIHIDDLLILLNQWKDEINPNSELTVIIDPSEPPGNHLPRFVFYKPNEHNVEIPEIISEMTCKRLVCGQTTEDPSNILILRKNNVLYFIQPEPKPDNTGHTKTDAAETCEITKMLTLSTAHLRPETRNLLDKMVFDQDVISNPGFTVYPKDSYGYFLYLEPNADFTARDDLPYELKLCLRLCDKKGCDVLCFDRDGTVIEALPHTDENDKWPSVPKPTDYCGYMQVYLLVGFKDGTATVTEMNIDFRKTPPEDLFLQNYPELVFKHYKDKGLEPISCEYVTRAGYEAFHNEPAANSADLAANEVKSAIQTMKSYQQYLSETMPAFSKEEFDKTVSLLEILKKNCEHKLMNQGDETVQY